MTRQDIDDIGDSVMKRFGEYTLFSNNCHRLLRRLFKGLWNKQAPEAADHMWFKKYIRPKYQNKKLSTLIWAYILALVQG